MDNHTTTPSKPEWLRRASRGDGDTLALVIAWSATHPGRLGEVARILGPCMLGRGGPRPEDDVPRLVFGRERPERTTLCAPLADRGLSRNQLRIEPTASGQELTVHSVGAASMRVDERPVTQATLRPGSVLEFTGSLLLLCERRSYLRAPSQPLPTSLKPEFGLPDDFGMVGESPAVWKTREQLAFVALRAGHVLILGSSGSGKELAARTLHGLSSRAARPLVARNAATIPEGLVDAELFGNVRNYPNPGTPERRGLIGEADGGTLFLDEIGEVPHQLQSHLLRVLDSGEFQRLGAAQPRTADVRLIAATNRDLSELKHDLAPRLMHHLTLPPLNEHRSDIPLLMRHIIRAAAAEDATIREMFVGDAQEPRIDPALTTALMRHEYTHNVRELQSLLWVSMRGSTHAPCLCLTDSVSARLRLTQQPAKAPDDLTTQEIIAALERHDWRFSEVWPALRLSSRHVLYRLLKKHGIETP